MKTQTLKKILFPVLALGLGAFLLFFFATCVVIGNDVSNHCQAAQREYGGDCVESLISLLQDESKGFRARNSAIWALGQLGDGRAIPVLQRYYTGGIPARESLDQTISQYELKKAIQLASGGFNITAWVWR